jgi:hypothetical protein
MSVAICLSTRPNIPADLMLQKRRCRNLGFRGEFPQRPPDRIWDLAGLMRLEHEPGHLP